MKPADIPEIRNLPLFRAMAETAFERAIRAAYVQNFPPQIELITEGEPADFLHVVIDGTVELFSSWHGRETTMATVRSLGTFILAATVKDAPYLMSARTLEKSRILLLPSEDVRAAFEADGEFARAVVTELAQCYRAVIKSTKNLKLRSSIERLANYLLRKQQTSGGRPAFHLDVEKRRLASYLGMTPENMSRAIKSLQPYGVMIEGSEVTIANPADLERLARPSPLIDDPAR